VFTHDPDFGTLLATLRASKPSVIQVRSQDILPGAMGKVVIRAIRAAEAYLDTGAVVTLEIFPPSHPAVADLRRRTTTTQMCKFRLDPASVRQQA
jgi:hypothetical protein